MTRTEIKRSIPALLLGLTIGVRVVALAVFSNEGDTRADGLDTATKSPSGLAATL